MSEKSFTILELHLGDGDINLGPLAVTGGFDETGETDDADKNEADRGDTSASDSGRSCSAKSIGGLLLALGALVAVGFGVLKLLGTDDPDERDD